ncbi:hypothetical protein ACIBO1_20395 [Micromonospora sp. NPDC049903]|uniref:hypothetical protein n=1 Tax=Micromonospora sp. NPDC049903 TaxID=3364276 RepID=UPI003793B08B
MASLGGVAFWAPGSATNGDGRTGFHTLDAARERPVPCEWAFLDLSPWSEFSVTSGGHGTMAVSCAAGGRARR